MSYIRCLSNPERLYIWYDVDGSVYVSQGKYTLKKLPPKVFHGLLTRWWRNQDDVEFEGGSLTLNHGTWKWKFHYKSWKKPVSMFEVTLYYIAHDVVRLLARKRRKR